MYISCVLYNVPDSNPTILQDLGVDDIVVQAVS